MRGSVQVVPVAADLAGKPKMFYGKNNSQHNLEENVSRPRHPQHHKHPAHPAHPVHPMLRGLADNPVVAPGGDMPSSNFGVGIGNNNPTIIDPSIAFQAPSPFDPIVPPGGWGGGGIGPVVVGGGTPVPGYIDAASGAYVGYPAQGTVVHTSPIYGTYLCPDGSIAANGQPCKGDPVAPWTPVTPTVFTPTDTKQITVGGPNLPSTNWFVPSPGQNPSNGAFLPSAEMIQAEIAASASRHHPYHAAPVRAPRPVHSKCRSGMMQDPNTGKCVSHFIQLSGLGAVKHPAAKRPVHPALRKHPAQKSNPLIAAALIALFLL